MTPISRDGNGTYSKTFTAVTGTVISSTDFNTQIDDIATALTNSLAKNGETVPTANIPMGNFKHTNVANAAANNQYAAAGQVQNGTLMWGGTAGGTSTALTISLTPAIGSYAAGQRFAFIAASNSGGATTLAVNGLATQTVNNIGWSSGEVVEVVYTGTAFYKTSHNVSGSVTMPFFQASAPTGWTQVTSQNDKMFRIVSGTGGSSGGSWAISGMSIQSANHYHGATTNTEGPTGTVVVHDGTGTTLNVSTNVHYHVVNTTTGTEIGEHTHTGDGTWRPAYIDIILATGNLAF